MFPEPENVVHRLLTSVSDPAELTRHLTNHYIGIEGQEKDEFVLALIMELGAARLKAVVEARRALMQSRQADNICQPGAADTPRIIGEG